MTLGVFVHPQLLKIEYLDNILVRAASVNTEIFAFMRGEKGLAVVPDSPSRGSILASAVQSPRVLFVTKSKAGLCSVLHLCNTSEIDPFGAGVLTTRCASFLSARCIGRVGHCVSVRKSRRSIELAIPQIASIVHTIVAISILLKDLVFLIGKRFTASFIYR